MTELIVRKGKPEDLERIMEIYRSARKFMAAAGNPGQWGRHFPPEDLIRRDIEEGKCHTIVEDGRIHGVFALCRGEDPTYARIYDGVWLNDAPYIAIHRVAGDGIVHGILGCASDYCKNLCDNVRIDTHRDNLPMRRQIERNGFVRCGTIYLADGSPRIAFHWNKNHIP